MTARRPYDLRRRLSAWVLGFVLVVSLVPRDLYHELFADHVDGVSCHDAVKGSPCAHAVVYNCHFDYSGSFTALDFDPLIFEALTLEQHEAPYTHLHSHFIAEVPQTQAGRGPPSYRSI